MRGRRITIQRLSKCGFMLCFITNPALPSRENFVLCFANIVLCLDIIVLCFHKLDLCCVWLIPCCVWKNVCCVPGIYCVSRMFVVFADMGHHFRLNFRPRSGQASDEVMRGRRAFWKVQKAFSGIIFSILFRASN